MYQFILKFNPNHDEKGRFASRSGSAATALSSFFDKHNKTDVTEDDILRRFGDDERREILDATDRANRTPPTNKLYSNNKDGTGGYTPERMAVHRAIIQDFLSPENIRLATPDAGEPPTFIILGGRGGSGKSSFTKGKDGKPAKINEFDSDKFLVLDADKVKEMLKPPYEGWNAACVHEESSVIFDAITSMSKSLGLNVVLDATLKSDKMGPMLEDLTKNGYKVEGHYMHLPRDQAATRAVKRYLGKSKEDRGRLVPPEIILNNKENERNFEKLIPYFSKWSAYDNQDREPKLIAKGVKKPKAKAKGA